MRIWSFRGPFTDRGNGMELSSSDAAEHAQIILDLRPKTETSETAFAVPLAAVVEGEALRIGNAEVHVKMQHAIRRDIQSVMSARRGADDILRDLHRRRRQGRGRIVIRAFSIAPTNDDRSKPAEA